jgi:coenzyme PQQ synthesis protein D (PqqD)
MDLTIQTKHIGLEDSIQVSEDVVFRGLDGEAVLLNLASGIYFGLNGTGTRIWNLIKQHGSLQTVFELMAQGYETPADTLGEDILQLVERLRDNNLVSKFPTDKVKL